MMADRDVDSTIREREVKSFKTINEQRFEMGLPDIEGGDIILNDTYLKGLKPEETTLPQGKFAKGEEESNAEGEDEEKEIEEV